MICKLNICLKAFLIIAFFFSFRIFISCRCDEDSIPFDFKIVEIENLDNSGRVPVLLVSDTMKSAAVAFSVILKGEEDWEEDYYSMSHQWIQFFNFPEAKAMEECPMLYDANNPIIRIFVVTLFYLSPDYPIDSDVSDIFLVRNNSMLYGKLEDILPVVNKEPYYDEPAVSFQIFCKENVINDQARFMIGIELSNHEILYGTTNVINIKPSF